MNLLHITNVLQSKLGLKQGSKVPVFVLGCQRSGTTMTLDILQHSPFCSIYHEGNENAFSDFRFKPTSNIKNLVANDSRPVVVFKPLNDSQYADNFVSDFSGSKIIWVYRNYTDVINSALEKWGNDQKDTILQIANKEDFGNNIYDENISTESLETLKRFANKEMSNADGAALMWYIRNKIFFDQNLKEENGVLLVKYEQMVIRSEDTFHRVFKHLGFSFNRAYTKNIYNTSIKKSPAPALNPEIELLCKRLLSDLDKVNYDHIGKHLKFKH